MRRELLALAVAFFWSIATPTLADPRIDAIRAEVRAGNAERALELDPDHEEAKRQLAALD